MLNYRTYSLIITLFVFITTFGQDHHYVTTSYRKLLKLSPTECERELIAELERSYYDIAYHPQSHKLYGMCNEGLYTIDVTTGEERFICYPGFISNALEFTTDGTLFCMLGSTIYSIDLQTGSVDSLTSLPGYGSAGDLGILNGKTYLLASNRSLIEFDLNGEEGYRDLGKFSWDFSLYGLADNECDGVLYTVDYLGNLFSFKPEKDFELIKACPNLLEKEDGHVMGSASIPNSVFEYLNVRKDTFVCGASVILQLPQDSLITYSWNNGASGNRQTFNSSGVKTYTWTSGNCSGVDSIYVHLIDTDDLLQIKDKRICFWDSLVVDLQSDVDIQWNDGSNERHKIFKESGDYWVKVDQGFCTWSDTFSLKVDTLLPLQLPKDTGLCKDESLFIELDESDIFKWNRVEMYDDFYMDKKFRNTLHRIKGACEMKQNVMLYYTDFIDTSIPNDTALCEEDEFTIEIKNPEGVIEWSTGESYKSIKVDSTASYRLTLYNNGCTWEDSIYVRFVDPAESVLPNDTAICNGDELLLDLHTLEAEIVWNDGDTSSTKVLSEDGLYIVKLNDHGCLYEDSIQLDLIHHVPELFHLDTLICEGDILAIDASQQFDADYEWNDGEVDALRYLNEAGSYTLSTSSTCSESLHQFDISTTECHCKALIPNAFSPNNDGLNDVFRPIIDCNIGTAEFSVYDLWGKLLYSSESTSPEWNAKLGGNVLPMGVYVYQLKIRATFGKTYYYKGNIHLLK